MKRTAMTFGIFSLLLGALAGHWIAAHPTIANDALNRLEDEIGRRWPALRSAWTAEPVASEAAAAPTPDSPLLNVAQAAANRQRILQQRDARLAELRDCANGRSAASLELDAQARRLANDILRLDSQLRDADDALRAALQDADCATSGPDDSPRTPEHDSPTAQVDLSALLEQVALAGRPVGRVEELVGVLRRDLHAARARLAEMEELSERCRAADARSRSLDDENASLQARLRAVQRKAASEREDRAKRVRELATANDDLASRCDALQRRAESAEDSRRKAEREAAAAKSKAAAAKRALADAQSSARHDQELLTTNILQAENEARALRSKLEKSRQQTEKLRAERDDLAKKLTAALRRNAYGSWPAAPAADTQGQAFELAEHETRTLPNGLTLELLDDDKHGGVKVRVSNGVRRRDFIMPLHAPMVFTNYANMRGVTVVALASDLPGDRARLALY